MDDVIFPDYQNGDLVKLLNVDWRSNNPILCSVIVLDSSKAQPAYKYFGKFGFDFIEMGNQPGVEYALIMPLDEEWRNKATGEVIFYLPKSYIVPCSYQRNVLLKNPDTGQLYTLEKVESNLGNKLSRSGRAEVVFLLKGSSGTLKLTDEELSKFQAIQQSSFTEFDL